MVAIGEAFTTAKVGSAVGFIQTTDQLDAALLEQPNVRPIGHQTIGQQNVSPTKHAPQSAQQADFALAFAGVPAKAEIDDRPAG